MANIDINPASDHDKTEEPVGKTVDKTVPVTP